MTPLAKDLAKSILKHRDHDDMGGITLNGTHFFDVSQLDPLADEVYQSGKRSCHSREEWKSFYRNVMTGKMFLPAPKTWLEGAGLMKNGRRTAILLNEFHPYEPTGKYIIAAFIFRSGTRYHYLPSGFIDPEAPLFRPFDVARLHNWREDLRIMGLDKEGADVINLTVMRNAVLTLALINTPNLIVYAPQPLHSGRIKQLARRGVKLRGHSNIHLSAGFHSEVKPTYDTDTDAPKNRRRLHFCRSHLRMTSRGLTVVSAHWRGDPALGVKTSDYVCTP